MPNDPWTLSCRTHWKEDSEFQEFSKSLYNDLYTFQSILTFCQVDRWPWPTNHNWIKDTEQVWNEFVESWNEERDYSNESPLKTVGYAAITFLFASLPYMLLGEKIGQVLTEFESRQVDVVYLYARDEIGKEANQIGFQDAENLIEDSPWFPPAFQEWFDRRYNSASWWLSYMVYERRNGLKPIIISNQAKLIK